MLLPNRSPTAAPRAPVNTDLPLWDRLTRGLLPLALGVAMTLALAGYRFGESNHAVYLVDALRQNDPALLANDWWTRSTLQYHFVFNRLSAGLMRVGLIEPAFVAGYVALAVLLHVAWRRLALCLGGDDGAYLASVILYHLMAAGTGLGVYHFLQNGAFLPSNVSNVATLWGVYLWVRGRPAWAGLWFGVAGLFHLNHALAGIGLWVGLTALAAWRARATVSTTDLGEGAGVTAGTAGAQPAGQPLTPALSPEYGGEGGRGGESPWRGAWFVGTTFLVTLSLPAIVPALRSVLSKTDSLPLGEFVELYVRLRHPHHYDPSSWPLALWLTFLVPVGLAVPAYRTAVREAPTAERRRAAEAFLLFAAMLAVALLGAGVWYVSEPLIQMSLYRFSIYPKLLSCVAAGWLIWRTPRGRAAFRAFVFAVLLVLTANVLLSGTAGRVPAFMRENAVALWLFALFATVALLRPRVLGWGRVAFAGLTTTCVVASLLLSRHRLGIAHEGLRGDDPGYMAVCEWARHNTPADAVFLVPPDEQSFRLHARRAIVVNFKNVPQLSGELVEWRDRLQAVLNLENLRALPTPFDRTLDAIRQTYAGLPAEHLAMVAGRYQARYVVTVRQLDAPALGPPLFSDAGGRYFLYDLGGR